MIFLKRARRSVYPLLALIYCFCAGGGYAQVQTLHTFCVDQQTCPDGGTPNGVLMDGTGDIFGSTYIGGAYGSGVVYELIPNARRKGWTYKLLHNFCKPKSGNCKDGIFPVGALIMDVSGNLYGATHFGGNAKSNNDGSVFELHFDPATQHWKDQILYTFCRKDNCSDGIFPQFVTYKGAASGALYDGVSPLFGTTAAGGIGTGSGAGVVFQLTPPVEGKSKWTEATIYEFGASGHDGAGPSPYGSLAFDINGYIYGTTIRGGLNGVGTVFELAPSDGTWAETVLYSFCSQADCADGANPYSNVVMNSTGALIGTTPSANGGGILFQLQPAGVISQISVLHAFCSDDTCSDGDSPIGGLTLDSSGNIFGTTQNGGVGQNGTIFEYSNSFNVIYRFCATSKLQKHHCPDGASPYGPSVAFDVAGNIFGSTLGTPTFNAGTTFEFARRQSE